MCLFTLPRLEKTEIIIPNIPQIFFKIRPHSLYVLTAIYTV